MRAVASVPVLAARQALITRTANRVKIGMTDGVVSNLEVIASLAGIFILFALALVLILREERKRAASKPRQEQPTPDSADEESLPPGEG